MEFKEFRTLVSDHFNIMTNNVNYLFEVNVDKEELVNTYLDSFPEGTNKIYRKRREYDCSCCKHFIKSIGNVVVIKDGKVETIWDLDIHDGKFEYVTKAMSELVKSNAVSDVYVSKVKKIGTEYKFKDLSFVQNKKTRSYRGKRYILLF